VAQRSLLTQDKMQVLGCHGSLRTESDLDSLDEQVKLSFFLGWSMAIGETFLYCVRLNDLRLSRGG
jgi:hypothetical protein